VIGAVGADIALLRITNPPADLTLLNLAEDVVLSAKVGDDVVVVGNRLGGGVASQTKGRLVAYGPSIIETSAQFQSGNSGSPIFDLRTNDVIGVAAYSETVTLQTSTNPLFLHSEDLRNFQQQVEQRWFGFRIDGVTRWETIDLTKWREQHARMDRFRDNSLALLAFLGGDLRTAKENVEMRAVIEKNDTGSAPRSGAGLEGNDVERADQLDNLFRGLRAYCDQGAHELQVDEGNFYGYFRTNPYWSVSIPDQLKFRSILKSEIDNAGKDLTHVKQDLLKHM
jgi:serine protease Do